MEFKPHAYQEYAIDYIKKHPVAAILLGCGLGKTSIALTAIDDMLHDSFEIRKVLVVAPIRVCTNSWPDEIRKWDHLSGIRFSVAVGTREERFAALRADAEVYIINRENLPWLVEKAPIRLDYDMAVIDELSSFKNWDTRRFKAFMKLRPRLRRVVGLTGTPAPNGLMDLYAEYRCLDMGERLGRYIGQYWTRYFVPERMSGPIVYSYRLRQGAAEEIYSRISDITLSMRAMDHLEMPSLIENRYPVRMSPEEREIYDTLRKDLLVTLETKDCRGGEGAGLLTTKDSITAANAAVLSNKLSQLSNGCVYAEDGTAVPIHSRKLDALEDILEAATSPVLVAYQFRHDLKRITERLASLGVTWAVLDREESILRWNGGRLQVGLIHPASAGHGLNLQKGGHTMVWYSLPWSLELYEQCRARIWRQGQQAKTVVISHIVTEGTIDDRILSALKEKSNTQDKLIEAVRAELE